MNNVYPYVLVHRLKDGDEVVDSYNTLQRAIETANTYCAFDSLVIVDLLNDRVYQRFGGKQ